MLGCSQVVDELICDAIRLTAVLEVLQPITNRARQLQVAIFILLNKSPMNLKLALICSEHEARTSSLPIHFMLNATEADSAGHFDPKRTRSDDVCFLVVHGVDLVDGINLP